MQAIEIAAALDAILSALDTRRHVSRLEPLALRAAGLEEMARRHAVAREAVQYM